MVTLNMMNVRGLTCYREQGLQLETRAEMIASGVSSCPFVCFLFGMERQDDILGYLVPPKVSHLKVPGFMDLHGSGTLSSQPRGSLSSHPRGSWRLRDLFRYSLETLDPQAQGC